MERKKDKLKDIMLLFLTTIKAAPLTHVYIVEFSIRSHRGLAWHKKTSDVGSQYRCGRVGRGIQLPASPQPHPQPPFNPLTHKRYQLQHPKLAFFVFSTRA